MTEDFLQYIWRYRLFTDDYTIDNDLIEIIDVGQLNTDSGPDFFNAKIKIGKTLWAGNVEIHKKSSDWFLHNHEIDESYDNVILHVVEKINKEVHDTKERKIPQIELKYDKKLFDNYSAILNNKHKIKCVNRINEINSFDLGYWLDVVLIERLERKSNDILHLLNNKTNDWEEVFYIILLRYFGLKVNTEPFEILARSLPFKYILKQKNSLLSIEAMLFGQAGFLENDIDDMYYKNLKKEYKFLRNKYSLQSLDVNNWKFMRIRPASFPTIRLAQIASLLYSNSNLFSKILEATSVKDIFKLFELNVSEYWFTHYRFGIESVKRHKKLGKQTINLIIINVIIPMLFVYGRERNIDKYKNKALDLLNEIKPEKNSIIRYWNEIGIETDNAFKTQSLLELYSNYCQKSNCLNCRIGNKLIIKN